MRARELISDTRLPRRGIAMLLVLISMMIATILTAAYLASRDNSAIMGENVANSAAARWAAESGLEIGAAVLQTKSDWRTSHTNGKLLDDLAVSGSLIDLDLLDLSTGLPPTDVTENVQLTSTATMDGVQQVSTAVAWVPPLTESVDLDLSEFGLFAANRITLANQATVMRWPKAPLSKLGHPVPLGTQAASASTIVIANNATVIDGALYSGPNPSPSLVSASNGTRLPVKSLKDMVPMPSAPSAGIGNPSTIPLSPDMNISGGSSTQNSTMRVSKATLSNATRTLRGAITLISDNDLELKNNAKLVVDGNVEIIVLGELKIDQGAIELKTDATLQLYVGDKLVLKDAYLGDLRTGAARDHTGNAGYMDPERLNIYRVPSQTSTVDWLLDDNSVVKSSLYGKNVKLSIRKTSALYGRAAAQEIEIKDDGSLFYDPDLNSHNGYTQSSSALFNPDATLKTAFKTVTSLDVSGLQSLADLLGLHIKKPGKRSNLLVSATAPNETPPVVAPTEPTPRPVEIVWQMTSFGSKSETWELTDAGQGADDAPTSLDE